MFGFTVSAAEPVRLRIDFSGPDGDWNIAALALGRGGSPDTPDHNEFAAVFSRGGSGERASGGPKEAGPPNQSTRHAEHRAAAASRSPPADAVALAAELHDKGWVGFSAGTGAGDWDLFVMRPDGTDRRPLTVTPGFNEAGVRFSPDGWRLLYYRMPRGEPLDNNTYGTFNLIIANADGSGPVDYGHELSWASWGPDGKLLACLAQKGIQIIDIATRQVIRQFPRKGIVQQLVWAPDGKRFVGTANGLGQFWNIGVLDPQSGAIIAVSETERYNCTPDWMPDSRRIVYSRGIIPQEPGRAELWLANAHGSERRALYAEATRHIYGACASPDQKYLLFTRSVEDLGKVDHSNTTLAIIRWSDTPMVGSADESLAPRLPNAHSGPRLDLGPGWEPHWTYSDLNARTNETRR
jgi:hypothetical protein